MTTVLLAMRGLVVAHSLASLSDTKPSEALLGASDGHR
jgi:hypothetical protein